MVSLRNIFFTISLGLFLAGCQTQIHYQGKSIQPDQLKKIKIGKHSKYDVLNAVGSPTTMSDYGGSKWFYISKTTETTAFFAPSVIEQKVTIITFNKNGIVESISTKDLKDAENVELAERLTQTAGHRDSGLKQLFGNFGRVAKKER